MAKVKLNTYEDGAGTMYFVKSKNLTQALQRATLLTQVLKVDNVSVLPPERDHNKKKWTVVLTVFKNSATIE